MSVINVTALNESFGVSGQVAFQETAEGLVLAKLRNAHGEATVYLQGAHLTEWIPQGQAPVIWLSPRAIFAKGKAIRGGIPICWPWFGAHPDTPGLPAHGIARTSVWEVTGSGEREDGSTWLALRLPLTDQNLWPYSTPVEILFALGKTLEIELVTRNLAAEAVVMSQALHAYFQVGDVRQVHIQGLDGCDFVDKTDDGRRKKQAGPISIAGEVDRIYLDSRADCLIEDPVLKRRIRIQKSGSASTIVWNPWAEKAAQLADLGPDAFLNMLCVESANADEDRVVLAPTAEHRLSVSYSVEPN
jgi:glucose-6-phosphate 1-epimerase